MSPLYTLTTCPRCGNSPKFPVAGLHALSRKDNKTLVCSSCGTDEAVLQFAGFDPWPGYPGVTISAWEDQS